MMPVPHLPMPTPTHQASSPPGAYECNELVECLLEVLPCLDGEPLTGRRFRQSWLSRYVERRHSVARSPPPDATFRHQAPFVRVIGSLHRKPVS